MLGDRSALKRTLEFSTPEDLMANFDRIPVVVTVITMFMSAKPTVSVRIGLLAILPFEL